jgi:hypothetical protein
MYLLQEGLKPNYIFTVLVSHIQYSHLILYKQSCDFFSKIEFDQYLKFSKNKFFSPLAKILPSWLWPLQLCNLGQCPSGQVLKTGLFCNLSLPAWCVFINCAK